MLVLCAQVSTLVEYFMPIVIDHKILLLHICIYMYFGEVCTAALSTSQVPELTSHISCYCCCGRSLPDILTVQHGLTSSNGI